MEALIETDDGQDNNVSIKKYMLRFALLYIALSALLAAISYFFDIDLGTASSVVVVMSSAMYAVGVFIQDHKRPPNKTEKTRMIWVSFAISWLLSIAVIVAITVPVLLLPGGVEMALSYISSIITSISIVVILAILAFVTLLYLALFYFSYGFFARKQYEGLVKKNKL
ncbi:MAG: ABZJ_00895 family protein [Cellvibrionaceae bacterium]